MSQERQTRRRVLGLAAAGAGGAALAGCGLFDHDSTPTPVANALQPLLTEAVALAGAYERVATAQPSLAARLTPLAADHRAHATELARLLGRAVPAASAPTAATGDGDVLTQLRAAEQTAQRNAATACRNAPAEQAPLIGSIAACRATHAEALR